MDFGTGTGTAWYKDDRFAHFVSECVDMIKSAIEAGYRHLDCVEVYGMAAEAGVAIQESGVPREELFVTIKVVETIEDVPLAIEPSLKKLRLDYVDL